MTGPTGEELLLNAPADAPLSDRPLALLAPRLASPVIEAARRGLSATLVLDGKGGLRAAENVVARRVRDGRRWVVVSTPRSGWTDCEGESGPGPAIWMGLAEGLTPPVYDREDGSLGESGVERDL